MRAACFAPCFLQKRGVSTYWSEDGSKLEALIFSLRKNSHLNRTLQYVVFTDGAKKDSLRGREQAGFFLVPHMNLALRANIL